MLESRSLARGTAGTHVAVDRWFLAAAERRNPHTRLDSRHESGLPWTDGNEVTPLVHGSAYFTELLAAVGKMTRGDHLMFTDWRGDPDERLGGAGSEVGTRVRRGRPTRRGRAGLVWRSHLDRFQFSASENRHLGDEIEAAGGQCLLDMRVRPLGSHHQKLVVLRHPGDPSRDVAYVGGIDLCHSRNDDRHHHGDPQYQEMARIYGQRPPWHDIQLAIRGPAVGDAETVFRERWEDRSPLSRNPIHLIGERLRREDRTAPARSRLSRRTPPTARHPGGPAAAHLPARRPRLPVRSATGSSACRAATRRRCRGTPVR